MQFQARGWLGNRQAVISKDVKEMIKKAQTKQVLSTETGIWKILLILTENTIHRKMKLVENKVFNYKSEDYVWCMKISAVFMFTKMQLQAVPCINVLQCASIAAISKTLITFMFNNLIACGMYCNGIFNYYDNVWMCNYELGLI